MKHQHTLQRRKKRLRYTLSKAANGRLRLSVFRSNRHISAQVIDDASGKTLASASSLEKELKLEKPAAVKASHTLGKLLGERCTKQGIEKVVFDRGAFAYHGRVRALADGAREGGLIF